LDGPDASGYYTLTLTGRTLPANASLLTGALGYAAMFQTNVPGYLADDTATPPVKGINVPAQDVSKTATGFTARRITVEASRCNLCHGKLGIFADSTFHSGQRNDPKMCAMCHNPNRASSGYSADSTAFVHRIHGASKRTYPDTWYGSTGLAADGVTPIVTGGYFDITYPGILNNCVQCHAPGGYNFEAGAAQVGNRLYRIVASGTQTTSASSALLLAPYAPIAAGAGPFGTSAYSSSDASATTPDQATTGGNLVNSPIANACFACHDGDMASQPGTSVRAHIEWGGGSIYRARGVAGTTDSNEALGRAEQCLACHGPNGIAPIKTVHGVE
jgi:OmcA/MtrC family decaheme c-type cytochrome